MVTPGANPSDFVEDWITNGFAGAPTVPTFNGFSLSQREAAQRLLEAWPRIAGTNKLDLTKPPFVLLAIVNRVDLASGNGAGEGRFVFGVNLPNSGGPGSSAQRMTVIFEYKLPPSASRQVWAQRFHALGALPLPSEDVQSDFNARLQMITDEFTRRGADPAGVNGSSLGQLRTNELLAPAFQFPWQWREYQLVGGNPAKLQITTTKQTPHGSLNNPSDNTTSPLVKFLNQNAQSVLDGTAVIPASMLGGESDGGNQWILTGVNDAVRNAFARQTCNGCHTGDGGSSTDVIDGFYHVSSVRSGGPDGTAKLSKFLTSTEVPRREVFMKATLCAGNCPDVGPAQMTASRVH
jgi:hypothetical protein